MKWIRHQKIEKILEAEIQNLQNVGIVSCLFEDIPTDSAGALLAGRNIAVRAGLHCAPEAHKFFNTYPAGTIRFSVNIFNQDKDFEELREVLEEIEKNL